MPPTPSKQCLTRLQREFKALCAKPEPTFRAAPDPNNILSWVFVFDGPADTVYEGGRYVGELHFPPEYPFKPPDVKMRTPNGRFDINKPICLSNSSFHPESWSPMWGVSTILTGFVSFFVSEEHTSGAIESTTQAKKDFAEKSSAFNVSHLHRLYSRVLPDEFKIDAASCGKQVEESGDGDAEASTTDATRSTTAVNAPPAKKERVEKRGRRK